jgi:fumarate reductase flavoprotein subunit
MERIDVLVAGAGAAGLTAALASAERGASVLVAEASGTFAVSSNTAMSTAMLPAAGTRWQKAAGIDDSPELFLADVMAKTKGQADLLLAAALTSAARDVTTWLADDCGIPFELVTDFNYPGHSRPRCHTVTERSGRSLHTHLLGAVRKRSEISVVNPLRLLHVEREGPILRCVLQVPGHDPEAIAADRVILASNGFGADASLVREHIPAAASLRYHGSPESTGDAIRIGTALGGETAFMDAFQGHASLTVPHSILLTWAAMIHGGVLLNGLGERFTDESVGYSESALSVAAQDGGEAWALFDEPIATACRAFDDFQELESAGAIKWANDPRGIAAITGAPVEAIRTSLAQIDMFASGTRQDSFGRVRWSHRLTAPFAVVRVAGALFHTQGGLRVDGAGHVLGSGGVVPGLFAAGGAAMGISGHGAGGYLGGNGLLSAFVLGHAAGAAAS